MQFILTYNIQDYNLLFDINAKIYNNKLKLKDNASKLQTSK